MSDKKLYKIEEDKKIEGVCGGLAEYLNVDPTLIRLGWALASLFTGCILGVIAYVICAVIIPKKSEIV